jgi:Uncharacterised nucleotidyltransferase
VKGRGRSELFWPSATQERILQTIFLPPERAEAAWNEVRPRLDLGVMEDGSYFLMPLLYRRLTELGVDDVDLPRLKGIYRRTWYRNQLLTESVQGPLGELHRQRISAMLLGACSTSRHYAERGLRWLEYFETVVSAAEVPRVGAVLQESGFTAAFEPRANALRPLPFLDDTGNIFVVCAAPPLDLLPPGRLGEGIARIQQRASRAEFGGEAVLALDPTDELLLICLTGTRPSARPVWVTDAMSLLLGTSGALVDWRRLCDQAESCRVGLRLEAALRYLRDVVAAPVPELAFILLAEQPVTRRELVAHRLTTRAPGLLGGFPATVGEYVRLSSDLSVPKAVAGSPRFLRQTWELDHLWQLPPRATVKAFRVLRRVPDQRQLSALSRGS